MGDEVAADDWWPVKVYRDHPRWETCDRWFLMPAYLLAELFVGRYEVLTFSRPTEACRAVRELRAKHPGCVLVY